jgi:uncharacterized membrane protein YvlD (DUF360 family)
LFLLLGLLLTAVLVWFLAAVLPGLAVEDFTSAALAAVVVTGVRWIGGLFVAALPLEQFWAFLLYSLSVNLVGLILAGLVIAGMRVTGVFGVLAAAVMLTAVEMALWPMLAAALMHVPF